MLSTKDIFYLVFVLIIIAYTLLDNLLRNKPKTKKYIFGIYIFASIGYLIITVLYLSYANRQDALLKDTSISASQQRKVLQSVVDNAIQEHKKLFNTISEANAVSLYLNQKISSLIENELTIKSFVIKVSYIFTSNDNINHIANPLGTRTAYLLDYDRTPNYLNLISRWRMNYPNERTAEFIYEFTPEDQIRVLNQSISTLEKYYYLRVPYDKNFYSSILTGSGQVIDTNFKVTIAIFINSKLFDKLTYIINKDIDGNTLEFYSKSGVFYHAKDKYIKLLKLPND